MSTQKNAPKQANELASSEALEKEGDRLNSEGLFQEALEAYRQAEQLNPNSRPIYQKLIATHAQLKLDPASDWEEEDMTEVLVWTMREQELATPRLKYLHRQLSGEDRAVTELLGQLLVTQDAEEEKRLLDAIEFFGERAVSALLHFFLLFKNHSTAEKGVQ